MGWGAGWESQTGSNNTFVGTSSGANNTDGTGNTFIGESAGGQNVWGDNNTYLGKHAGYKNQSASRNVAIGDSAGFNSWLSRNVFVGSKAGFANSSGGHNTLIGTEAGFNNSGTGNLFLGYKAGHKELTSSNLLYIANDADKAIIYGNFSTGQLLFGKPDPTGYVFKGSRTLNVLGGILADSIRVALSNNWADHVFSDSYRLLPLNDVESFIQANRHLPGIPTEREVKQNGISLADMNVKLLEKIEELTLYVISQQKQIDELTRLVKSNDQ